jgi:hypothetical protein
LQQQKGLMCCYCTISAQRLQILHTNLTDVLSSQPFTKKEKRG